MDGGRKPYTTEGELIYNQGQKKVVPRENVNVTVEKKEVTVGRTA